MSSRIRQRERKRCDARIKNPIKTGKNGVRVSRGPFCNAWAMPNGRCRVHGGASTGPKSPEGKARVVAAMVEGRREWVERRRAEGGRFTAGRKGGDAWVTEAMRERARAEARRLGAGRFTLDRSLTLALIKSANGDPAARARAKAMLAAHEEAAAEKDRRQALTIVDGWRGRFAAYLPSSRPAAEPPPCAPLLSDDPSHDPNPTVAAFWRNVDLALTRLGQVMGREAPQGSSRHAAFWWSVDTALDIHEGVLTGRLRSRDIPDLKLRLDAAKAMIKAALRVDKNMLKAPRSGPFSAKT
jgi:hypothetical protein